MSKGSRRWRKFLESTARFRRHGLPESGIRIRFPFPEPRFSQPLSRFILYQEITGISLCLISLVQWLTNSGLGKWKSDSDSGFRKVMSAETRCISFCFTCPGDVRTVSGIALPHRDSRNFSDSGATESVPGGSRLDPYTWD